MLKKIKRYKRLATLRKRDVSKEIANSNLLKREISKNEDLINQINDIMKHSKDGSSQKIVSSGYFKNNAQLLSTLQSQKNIANNRNKYANYDCNTAKSNGKGRDMLSSVDGCGPRHVT